MKNLAIAIAGVLAAPMAMANCDTQLDRIEARVQAADMEPRNEQVLVDWLQQQRVAHAGATVTQCTQLAAEIERQMQEKGYFASVSQQPGMQAPDPQQTGAPQASTLEARRSGVAVEAAPAEVVVQQPAADIDVQQQPAEVEVEMQQAEVLVQVPDPRVQVTQAPPQVTVNQPDPKVRVEQKDPMVSIDQPEPDVTVTQGEPEVTVQQGEPQVSVHEQPAIVDVQQGEPQVEVQQADGGNVAVGESEVTGPSASLAGAGSADTIGRMGMEDEESVDPWAPTSSGASDSSLASESDTATDSSLAAGSDMASGSKSSEWEDDRARAFANPAAGDSEQVAASELVGHTVVDSNGATVGRVREALKRPGDDQVYVRIDVAGTSDLDARELVLGVDRLERNAGNLLVRGEPDQVLTAAAEMQVDDLEPADSEQVVLSGEW